MTRLGKLGLILILAWLVYFLNRHGIRDGLEMIGMFVGVWGGLFLVLAIIGKIWVWLTEDQY